jgi:hypothetical protein
MRLSQMSGNVDVVTIGQATTLDEANPKFRDNWTKAKSGG